jgi:hypothetical protein
VSLLPLSFTTIESVGLSFSSEFHGEDKTLIEMLLSWSVLFFGVVAEATPTIARRIAVVTRYFIDILRVQVVGVLEAEAEGAKPKHLGGIIATRLTTTTRSLVGLVTLAGEPLVGHPALICFAVTFPSLGRDKGPSPSILAIDDTAKENRVRRFQSSDLVPV